MIKYILLNDFYSNIYLNNFIVDLSFLIGQSLLKRVDSFDLFSSILLFFKQFNISFNLLHVLNIHLGNLSISD